jgi:hypothetical protein
MVVSSNKKTTEGRKTYWIGAVLDGVHDRVGKVKKLFRVEDPLRNFEVSLSCDEGVDYHVPVRRSAEALTET